MLPKNQSALYAVDRNVRGKQIRRSSKYDIKPESLILQEGRNIIRTHRLVDEKGCVGNMLADFNLRPSKPRTVFSDHQMLVLETAYQRSKYPDVSQRAQLALVSQLSEDRVKIWFQNRRAKEKRDNEDDLALLAQKVMRGPNETQLTGAQLVSHVSRIFGETPELPSADFKRQPIAATVSQTKSSKKQTTRKRTRVTKNQTEEAVVRALLRESRETSGSSGKMRSEQTRTGIDRESRSYHPYRQGSSIRSQASVKTPSLQQQKHNPMRTLQSHPHLQTSVQPQQDVLQTSSLLPQAHFHTSSQQTQTLMQTPSLQQQAHLQTSSQQTQSIPQVSSLQPQAHLQTSSLQSRAHLQTPSLQPQGNMQISSSLQPQAHLQTSSQANLQTASLQPQVNMQALSLQAPGHLTTSSLQPEAHLQTSTLLSQVQSLTSSQQPQTYLWSPSLQPQADLTSSCLQPQAPLQTSSPQSTWFHPLQTHPQTSSLDAQRNLQASSLQQLSSNQNSVCTRSFHAAANQTLPPSNGKYSLDQPCPQTGPDDYESSSNTKSIHGADFNVHTNSGPQVLNRNSLNSHKKTHMSIHGRHPASIFRSHFAMQNQHLSQDSNIPFNQEKTVKSSSQMRKDPSTNLQEKHLSMRPLHPAKRLRARNASARGGHITQYDQHTHSQEDERDSNFECFDEPTVQGDSHGGGNSSTSRGEKASNVGHGYMPVRWGTSFKPIDHETIATIDDSYHGNMGKVNYGRTDTQSQDASIGTPEVDTNGDHQQEYPPLNFVWQVPEERTQDGKSFQQSSVIRETGRLGMNLLKEEEDQKSIDQHNPSEVIHGFQDMRTHDATRQAANFSNPFVIWNNQRMDAVAMNTGQMPAQYWNQVPLFAGMSAWAPGSTSFKQTRCNGGGALHQETKMLSIQNGNVQYRSQTNITAPFLARNEAQLRQAMEFSQMTHCGRSNMHDIVAPSPHQIMSMGGSQATTFMQVAQNGLQTPSSFYQSRQLMLIPTSNALVLPFPTLNTSALNRSRMPTDTQYMRGEWQENERFHSLLPSENWYYTQ